MILILGTIFAGLLGLAFGSFLNVGLSRWPEGESIALPRSHCRQCGRTLTWWENVPLLSWLVLRGRCSSALGDGQGIGDDVKGLVGEFSGYGCHRRATVENDGLAIDNQTGCESGDAALLVAEASALHRKVEGAVPV